MISDDIKQFKLVSGEEILAQVISWPDEDEENQIIVSQAMKLVSYEPNPLGPRLYLLRPWMVLQDNPDQQQILYYDQVVGMAHPSSRMVNQYITVLASYITDSDEATDESKLTEEYRFDSDTANIITFPGGRTVH